MIAVTAALVAIAVWLAIPSPLPRPRAPRAAERSAPLVRGGLAAGLGLACAMVFGGGVLTAGMAGLAAWRALDRVGAAAAAREAARARADLVGLVGLVALALRAGSAVPDAVASAAAALPGPAADRLHVPLAELQLGAEPAVAWAALSADPALAPLGRTLARVHRSGAPVADAIAQLADDLAAGDRLEAEERARAVGVKAAVPLGLCFLPAFLALGIVPLIAGLARALDWGA